LDPDQYRAFLSVALDETVTYRGHLALRGRTETQGILRSPRAPASVEDRNRNPALAGLILC